MPESRNRKPKAQRRKEAEEQDVQGNWAEGMKLSPSWWAPVMVTFMLIGLLWVVIFYLSGGLYPIPKIGNWNLMIAFGIAMVGFLMTLRWR